MANEITDRVEPIMKALFDAVEGFEDEDAENIATAFNVMCISTHFRLGTTRAEFLKAQQLLWDGYFERMVAAHVAAREAAK